MNVDEAVKKYAEEERGTYRLLAEKTNELLSSIFKAKGIVPHSITFREKDPGSLKQKILREPKNYEERFYGPTTLREAIEHSRNIVSIRLLNHLGVAPAIRLAHKMGIKSYLEPNLTLALGSTGVSPLEITSAYATIANGGIYREPVSILKIVGPDGAIIEEKQPKETIALSEQTAYIMTDLLKGVIKRGTGRAARSLRHPAAGKTGTTNDCTDAWFIGFTPQLATSVWVGFDTESGINT